jgi:hypothetical protein
VNNTDEVNSAAYVAGCPIVSRQFFFMTTKELLSARLEELNQQAEAGNRILESLDAQRQEAQQTLLRISGAIQVLEELLAANSERPPGTG